MSVAPEAESRGGSEGQDPGCRIWLYKGREEDPVRAEDLPLPVLSEGETLWVDIDLDRFDDLSRLWDDLGVDNVVSPLTDRSDSPALVHHNGVMQLSVTVIGDGPDVDPTVLHCVVAENWVVTLHHGPLELADRFNEPFDGHARLGDLDGPTFLSLVLDWQLSGYFELIEKLQADIDRLDEELLTASPREGEMLDRLHGLRSRVRLLRATLGPHRQVFGPLGHPESDNVLGARIAMDYQRLDDRLRQALDAVDTAREMIVGSFDIFMTRTAQATNEIMKRLTVISVLLLPAVVIAGIMGMNFKVGFFEQPWMFWVVLAVMLALALATLWVGRRREWF